MKKFLFAITLVSSLQAKALIGNIVVDRMHLKSEAGIPSKINTGSPSVAHLSSARQTSTSFPGNSIKKDAVVKALVGDQPEIALSELFEAAGSLRNAPVVGASNDAPRGCHNVCIVRDITGYCLRTMPVCP